MNRRGFLKGLVGATTALISGTMILRDRPYSGLTYGSLTYGE